MTESHVSDDPLDSGVFDQLPLFVSSERITQNPPPVVYLFEVAVLASQLQDVLILEPTIRDQNGWSDDVSAEDVSEGGEDGPDACDGHPFVST